MADEAETLEQSESEIQSLVEGASDTAPVASAPASSPEGGTPPGTPGDPGKVDDPPAKVGDAPDPPDPSAPPQDKLLAGKFKTVDDLDRSIDELSDKLGAFVDLDGKTPEQKEKLYSRLYERFNKRNEAENQAKAEQIAREEAERNRKPQVSEQEKADHLKKMNEWRLQEIGRKIKENEDLHLRYKMAGVDFPSNKQQLEQMRADAVESNNRELYDLWKFTTETIKQHGEEVDNVIREYEEKSASRGKLIEDASAKADKDIRAIVEQLGLKFTDAEIKGFIGKALEKEDNPMVFQVDNLGIATVRESGILDYFWAKVLSQPDVRAKVVSELEARGRTAQAKAISDLAGKVPAAAPSQSSMPGAQQRTTARKKTAEDFEQAGTVAEIDEGLDELIRDPH